MNDKFKISIDDVQEFLKTVVKLRWDKTIITPQGRVPATKLSDLAFNGSTPATLRVLDIKNNPITIYVGATPISFETYSESFDYSDIDALLDYVVEYNLSDLWIKFLVKKHGSNYQNYADKFCKHEKNLLTLKTYDQIEKLDSAKRAILKAHESKLKKYSDIEKLIYGNNNSKSFDKK